MVQPDDLFEWGEGWYAKLEVHILQYLGYKLHFLTPLDVIGSLYLSSQLETMHLS